MECSFELEFYKRRTEWLEGGRVGPDPLTLWECKRPDTGFWIQIDGIPKFSERFAYRWTRPTIHLTVNSRVYDLPAPERKEPEKYTSVWLTSEDGSIVNARYTKSHIAYKASALANGRIFLTRKDAQAWADFERDCRLGGM